RAGVVAGGAHGAEPQEVGLLLELARVLELRRLGRRDAGGAGHRVDRREEEPEQRGRRPHLPLLLLADDVMAAHVAHLVAAPTGPASARATARTAARVERQRLIAARAPAPRPGRST